MPKKVKAIGPTREERVALLEELWFVHASKLLEKLKSTPAKELDAASLNSARQLLSDNGVTAETLNKDEASHGRTLADEASRIGPFEDPPTDSLSAALATPFPVPMDEKTISALKRLEDH